jgi:hypothetical protein
VNPQTSLALATSLRVLSISAGAGVAALLGITLGDWLAWLLTSLQSTLVYLSVAALEMATARALHINLGEQDPEQR